MSESKAYEDAMRIISKPLSDYIFIVFEVLGQENGPQKKALTAFFSQEDADTFLKNQQSLYPNRVFGVEKGFDLILNKLEEEKEFLRKKFLEKESSDE